MDGANKGLDVKKKHGHEEAPDLKLEHCKVDVAAAKEKEKQEENKTLSFREIL